MRGAAGREPAVQLPWMWPGVPPGNAHVYPCAGLPGRALQARGFSSREFVAAALGAAGLVPAEASPWPASPGGLHCLCCVCLCLDTSSQEETCLPVRKAVGRPSLPPTSLVTPLYTQLHVHPHTGDWDLSLWLWRPQLSPRQGRMKYSLCHLSEVASLSRVSHKKKYCHLCVASSLPLALALQRDGVHRLHFLGGPCSLVPCSVACPWPHHPVDSAFAAAMTR